jgi:hypothetical protein
MEIVKSVLAVHAVGWLIFFFVTIRTISPDEVRRHALAAFLTALVCGFLWPVLLFKDLTGNVDR